MAVMTKNFATAAGAILALTAGAVQADGYESVDENADGGVRAYVPGIAEGQQRYSAPTADTIAGPNGTVTLPPAVRPAAPIESAGNLAVCAEIANARGIIWTGSNIDARGFQRQAAIGVGCEYADPSDPYPVVRYTMPAYTGVTRQAFLQHTVPQTGNANQLGGFRDPFRDRGFHHYNYGYNYGYRFDIR